jgi:hypothetical protein
MKKLVKIVVYAIVLLPILFVAQWIYFESSQSSQLLSLCDTAKKGNSIQFLLIAAASNEFELRTNGAVGKDKNDWHDREYLRIGAWLKKVKQIEDNYTVVFAKSGIGYYACIVTHEHETITKAWFEDRSS